MLVDVIFGKKWLNSRSELQYPLGKNQEYRIEVNKWLKFFDKKKWLDEKLIKRLQSANTWSSYYSKINELRTGYFFEIKLNFVLTQYEAQTTKEKNVEFKGTINDIVVFIEVKTPLDLDRKLWKGGWFNSSDKVYDLLDKAIEQLPNNASAIVVFSDDLNVSLIDDTLAQNSIWTSFNSSDYQKVSAVCILGNIYHEYMYEMLWAINDNASFPLKEEIFKLYPKIEKL